MKAMATTVSRRFWLSRLLVAAAVAPVVGVKLAEPVAAGKKKRKKPNIGTVEERTANQRYVCETGDPPGKLAVLDGPGGSNTTECKGGEHDGDVCYNTKKATKCYLGRTQDPTTKPGGGGAVPPGGGNEDPTGGGANAGGGAAVPPTGGVDSGGGSVPPVLE
jgi:hypothetical protein